MFFLKGITLQQVKRHPEVWGWGDKEGELLQNHMQGVVLD